MGDLSELSRILEGKVIVGADITEKDISGVDVFKLAAFVTDYFSQVQGIKLLNKEVLDKIMNTMKVEKMPKEIELIKNENFRPSAKDMKIKFQYFQSRIEPVSSSSNDFVAHFNDRFQKLKKILLTRRNYSSTPISSISEYMSGREVSTVGMVYEKKSTRNGHILVTLEDETGTVNVLFVRPERQPGMRSENIALYNQASRIAKDDVIAVRGRLSKGLLIANDFAWPDIPIRARKATEDDFAVAFVSDVHVGHKLFMEKQFTKMLQWLNGGIDYKKELAEKVKFAVFCGDLVDGIGVYPEQEKELIVNDIYAQYAMFFELLKGIPDYIDVFVLPGNHDATRRAEPQPELDRELAKYNTGNIHLVTNPVTLVLNSGTWQARTAFQIKQGHIPTPAILPVYEAKTRNLNLIDFNTIT